MKQTSQRRRNIRFYIATAVLSILFIFLAGTTVYSRENARLAQMEQYYRQLEKDMVRQVRAYLEENGFRNSGVTLTRVADESDERIYTLTVHHNKIDRMDETMRQELDDALGQFGFEYEHCVFKRRFLLY